MEKKTDNNVIIKKKNRKKCLIILSIILAVIIALFTWGYWLKVEKYSISSDKIDRGLKIVFISDLHNCFFGGTDQSGLKKEIEKAEPDIVIFGGDVIDGWGGTKHALTLMKWAANKYPCFYTPGNHEAMHDNTTEFIADVEKTGVSVCMGNYSELEIRNQPIRIYGLFDRHDFSLDDFRRSPDDRFYNILIAHQPEMIDLYLNNGRVKFDLILSGHAHAGQWRIPGILDQGLYAPDQGLFPEYTNGMYTYDDTIHIISRGLAKPLRMIFIPRIFNRPELSVIEIS